MSSTSTRAITRDIKTGARLMLKGTWRIQSALFPWVLGNVPDDVLSLLGTATRQERGQRAAGREGHWSYDFNRHIAAKQARLALRWMRRHGIVSVEQKVAA